MERPIERLKRKLFKENLWFFILNILEDGDRYGKEIRQEVKKAYGFVTGNVTSYKVLYHLTSGGYVGFYERGRKKYYRITPKGRKEIRDAKKLLKSV